MVVEKFQIYSVKTTSNTFVSQRIESVQFCLCPQANLSPRLLSLSPRQTDITHSSRTAFSEDIAFFLCFFHTAILSEQKEVGEDYVVEKLPKLTSALVTSFDKFHHLCNLYIFGLCFVVQ